MCSVMVSVYRMTRIIMRTNNNNFFNPPAQQEERVEVLTVGGRNVQQSAGIGSSAPLHAGHCCTFGRLVTMWATPVTEKSL